MELEQNLLLLAAIIGGGLLSGFFLRYLLFEKRPGSTENKLKIKWKQEEKGFYYKQKDADGKLRQEIKRTRENLEKEKKRKKQELFISNKKIQNKEHELHKRKIELTNKINQLNEKINGFTDKKNYQSIHFLQVQEEIQKLEAQLAGIHHLNKHEAEKRLGEYLIDDVKEEAGALIKQHAKETLGKLKTYHQEAILQALQENAAAFSSQKNTLTVHLPNDKIKGQLIGKEGRNIRAFQASAGIDLLIDDTPSTLLLSGFDPIQKQIAKKAIEKLCVDGKIYPAKIDEILKKTQSELLEELPKLGQAAASELGITGLHPEILVLLGKLHYYTFDQTNFLDHSKQTARFAEELAKLCHLNPELVKRAAFLHDIGLALEKEDIGSHWDLGAEIALKHKESPEVAHAIKVHHHILNAHTLTALLVAFAIEFCEKHPAFTLTQLLNQTERIQTLEEVLAKSNRLKSVFALQTENQIKVIVEPDSLEDHETFMLARSITHKVKETIGSSLTLITYLLHKDKMIDYTI